MVVGVAGAYAQRAAVAQEARPWRTHDLRHGAASIALEAGAYLKTSQARLGHASRPDRWQPGLPVDIAPHAGLVVIRPHASSTEAVARQGHLRLPARVRHACHLTGGDRLLMAAHPDQNLLFVYTMADSTIAVPFGVLIFTAFMSEIPEELMQAAKADGASTSRTFWSVILPLSRNSILTVSLFAFLWAWSDFIFATTLDQGGAHEPITLGIYHYIGNNNQQWNAIMATAVVASIPATILLVVAQRYIAAGLTSGAVKD